MPELEYYIEFKPQISESIQIKKPLNITSLQIKNNEEQTMTTHLFTSFENCSENRILFKNAENIIITFSPLSLITKTIHLIYSFNYHFHFFFFTNYDT